MAVESSRRPVDDLETLARRRFPGLTQAEVALLRAAPKGEQASCGPSQEYEDSTNDPAQAASWGPAREIRAELIRWLCVDPEARGQVDPKGVLILGGKILHKLDLSYVDVLFPLIFLKCRLTDDADLYSTRIPRLSLQGSWVCSINADGADVKGGVFLRNGFTAKGEVRLLGAQFGGDLDCEGGTFKNPLLPDIPESGMALNADGMRVTGSVLLANGFTAEGEVRLLGARIGGDLGCDGGTLKNPPQGGLAKSGSALNADRVRVTGSVFLRKDFTGKRFSAEGEVCLLGSQIGGNLECDGGVFKNPPRPDTPESGKAVNAAGADVKGYVFLRNGFRAEGEVRLLGAQIGEDLTCVGGTFKNPPQADLAGSGKALSADRADVKGGVLLRGDFKAEGEVRLPGARIGGDLDCEGGTFKNPPLAGLTGSGKALFADGVDVKGDVFLRKGFAAEGDVRLPGAQIGGNLECRGGTFAEFSAHTAVIKGNLWIDVLNAKRATIYLTNASAGALGDSGEASWPDPSAGGELRLDGFVYGRISRGPRNARKRLEWLSRQKWFTLQPYRQLAKVLREAGDDPGARRVLYEMERRRHRLAVGGLGEILRGWVLRPTIGYGYYPGRALWGLVMLTLVGALLFGTGYLGGSMTPTEKDAYARFWQSGVPPAHYPRFNALVYSLENSLPLVKLGQDSYWTPKPNSDDSGFTPNVSWPSLAKVTEAKVSGAYLVPRLKWPRLLRVFRWGQILAGWMLATFFVAGVTGVVRKD